MWRGLGSSDSVSFAVWPPPPEELTLPGSGAEVGLGKAMELSTWQC